MNGSFWDVFGVWWAAGLAFSIVFHVIAAMTLGLVRWLDELK